MESEIKDAVFYENCVFAWVTDIESMIITFDVNFHKELVGAYLKYYGISELDFINAAENDDESYRNNAPKPLVEGDTQEDSGCAEWEFLHIEITDGQIIYKGPCMDSGSSQLIDIIEALGWNVRCDKQTSEETYVPASVYYVEKIEAETSNMFRGILK